MARNEYPLQRHACLLAAGERVRVAVEEPGKAHLVEGFIGQPAGCGPSFDSRRYGEDDVAADR